ncbi:hypothetical protein CEXT_669571 [Caerostris extrusa]|uniref:Uncharacterized protein n=1 Tax=Caerostris extrusa TaxID=172846 RepID=A0AAV4Y1J8_CAEEX|nr:hypothetical protein CEXT_669571 [Caerostris extrusa]
MDKSIDLLWKQQQQQHSAAINNEIPHIVHNTRKFPHNRQIFIVPMRSEMNKNYLSRRSIPTFHVALRLKSIHVRSTESVFHSWLLIITVAAALLEAKCNSTSMVMILTF